MTGNERPDMDSPATEATPLMPKDLSTSKKSWLKPIHLVLLCGFLTQAAFGVTQIPLVYVFRVMTCEAYYQSSTKPPHLSDKCSVPEIDANTAKAVALLGFSTVFFGTANLFLTGWAIKRFGVKAVLALQVFWPAARLAVQSAGVAVGSARGIVIIQCSQIITIIGGPWGYMLALNNYVTEVTNHKERTGYLGMLQGCTLFGSSIGFLLGGILAETALGIISPFYTALIMFMGSTVYVLAFLPHIAPIRKDPKEEKRGLARMLGPFKTIAPSKWILQDGRVHTEYGGLILAVGVFLGVLATGYSSTLLQMYATDVFGFGPKRNSCLISMHMFLRGSFLTVAFPRIIAGGRKWMERRDSAEPSNDPSTNTSGTATPSDQAQLANAMQEEDELRMVRTKSRDEQDTFEFDLIYTRFSLLVDSILTLGASFVGAGWQMFLIAAILPLGAGTASAAKGTILQMCPAADRTDALSAIAFVEMMARMTTTFVFGLIFAAFASIAKTYLVFTCNAGVALVGFLILLLSRFPPEGSKRREVKRADDDHPVNP